jgi:hypothetical protein
MALAVVAAALVGCSGSDASDGTPLPSIASTTTTLPPAPSTAATTIPTTSSVPATTTAPPTTTEPPTTTAACPVFTDTDVSSDGFPGRLSGLVGADVRAGAHPCFERFVLELQGTGDFPGYRVFYQDPPITDDPRGEPVDVAGNAFIVVVVESWMTTIEGEGYHGATRITPPNVSHIKELVMLGNFESVTTWAIGVDERKPFKVSVLDGPPRLVVDISTA